MPDIGVLQLKISADASSASRSLKTLSDRLTTINTLSKDFSMSNIATQIGDIVKAVSSTAGASTAAKNLGTLLNAIAAFSKVKNLGMSEAQVRQISDLKDAVSGFSLGTAGTQLNKMREALGGEWNTDQAQKARDAIEILSGSAKELAGSGIKEAAKSVEQLAKGTENVGTATQDMTEYKNAVEVEPAAVWAKRSERAEV